MRIIYTLIFLNFFLTFNIYSQVRIKFSIKELNKSLTNIHYKLYNSNNSKKSIKCIQENKSINSVIILDFEINKYYVIEFIKEGFNNSRIFFDTKVSTDNIKLDESIDISMFKSFPGINTILFKDPQLLLSINSQSSKLESNKEYEAKMLKNRNKLIDEINGWTRVQYKRYLDEAKKNLAANNKEGAVKSYLFYLEKNPYDKEISDQMNSLSKQGYTGTKYYSGYMKQGDDLFNIQSYMKAIEAYQKAAAFNRKNGEEATAKIIECKKRLVYDILCEHLSVKLSITLTQKNAPYIKYLGKYTDRASSKDWAEKSESGIFDLTRIIHTTKNNWM